MKKLCLQLTLLFILFANALPFFAVSSPLPVSKSKQQSEINVIIDTDMGWDDWLAIAFLVSKSISPEPGEPRVNILGVTVNGVGETHLAKGVDNLLKLLSLYRAGLNIPVLAGAEQGISGYSHPFPDFIRKNADTVGGYQLHHC